MQGQEKAIHTAVWLGTAMLVLSGLLQVSFPRAMGPLPAGLHTPVLALEIARSAEELEAMFGPLGSRERAQWVVAVDRGNLIDFAFIVVYGAFLIACARVFEAERPARFKVVTGLAVLAGMADAAENVCLYAITGHLGGEYSGPLLALIFATWVKWLSIAACLWVLSPALRMRGGSGSVSGFIAAAALPITVAACALRGIVAELMLIAITLAFLALWIEALHARFLTR